MSRAGQAGFTLVELLVASAIFFVFTVAVLGVYARSHDSFVLGQTRMEARQNARVAVETLAADLRMAGFDPSGAVDRGAGEPVVVAADRNGVAFVSDADRDGTSDRIEYARVGDRIERRVAPWTGSGFGPAQPDVLAAGIEAFELRFFDDSSPGGRELTTPVAAGDLPSIGRVELRVMAAHEIASARARYPLELDVSLRNAVRGTP